MKHIISLITRYFRILFLLAVFAGLAFPNQVVPLYGLLVPLITVAMYLGAIDIDYASIPTLLTERKGVLFWYLVMVIILPVILFASVSWFSSDAAIARFILASAPSGIAAITFTRLMGGNALLSLFFAITTTITFPFVFPFLAQFLLGSIVEIDTIPMFFDLLLFCIIPICLGYLTQRFLPSLTDILRPHLDRVSIVLIACMIAGPVAYNAEYFFSLGITSLVTIISGLFLLSCIIHVVGWLCLSKSTWENRIAGSLAKGFMNISIATVIAAKYFSPEVLLIVMLYEFPWDLMLIPFQRAVQKRRPSS